MGIINVLERVQAHHAIEGPVVERQRTAFEIIHMTDRIALIPCNDLVAVPDVEGFVIVADLVTKKSRLIARSNVKNSTLELGPIVGEQIVGAPLAIRISS